MSGVTAVLLATPSERPFHQAVDRYYLKGGSRSPSAMLNYKRRGRSPVHCQPTALRHQKEPALVFSDLQNGVANRQKSASFRIPLWRKCPGSIVTTANARR